MRSSRGRAFQVERRTNMKATGWEVPESEKQVGAGVARWWWWWGGWSESGV